MLHNEKLSLKSYMSSKYKLFILRKFNVDKKHFET